MISAATKTQGAPKSASRTARVSELDWVKGALIVFMVIYHAINYSKYRPLAFEYLAFLPPSFLLITGFIVGQIYASKYDPRSAAPYLRLAVRGGKLLGIFVLLNVLNSTIQQGSFYYGWWAFADNASAIFLSGSGRVAIFEVLLPIAYFLLIAPALLWIRVRYKAAIFVSAIAIVCVCVALESRGITFENLGMLSAGIIGMAVGIVPMQRIDYAASKWPFGVVSYSAYRLCGYLYGERYWVQMFGALATLFLLYSIATHLRNATTFFNQTSVVGQYSLLGYMIQIPVLQVFVRIFGAPQSISGVLLMILAAAFVTFAGIRTAHYLRFKSRAVDRVYKGVFN